MTGGERDILARLKNKLSDEDQYELGAIFRKYEVVTFSSTFVASALAFGCIGFLTAIVTSSWIFVGLFTVVSFALNNPVSRYAIIADMPFSEKFLVVLFAQFGASYNTCLRISVRNFELAERSRPSDSEYYADQSGAPSIASISG